MFVATKCEGCGNDLEELREWLNEPNNIEYRMFHGELSPLRLRSHNHQKALDLIRKCDLCREYFKEMI